MIRNARQYRITQAQAAKLEQALTQLTAAEADHGAVIHPRLRQAEQEALRSQIEDLREQLADYDALRTRKRPVLNVGSLLSFCKVKTGPKQP